MPVEHAVYGVTLETNIYRYRDFCLECAARLVSFSAYSIVLEVIDDESEPRQNVYTHASYYPTCDACYVTLGYVPKYSEL